MEIMPADRLRVFADLIHAQLGVEVRLKGRRICVAYGKRPVIFLPNLEMAKEEDLKPLFGFALHEAGHLRYSRHKHMRAVTDFLWKYLHNAFEDQYVERRLRKNFPGAREMLRHSHDAGYRLLVKGEKEREALLGKDDRPYLGEPGHVKEIIEKIGKEQIVERMKALSLDASDESVLREVTKRLEICRLAWLWLYDWREGEDEAMREAFRAHPWKPVLDDVNKEKTRNTEHAVAKAKELIRRLDAHPVLPGDARPVAEMLSKRDRARELRREARAARREARRLREERAERIAQRVAETPEAKRVEEIREAIARARADADPATSDRVAGLEAEAKDALKAQENAGAEIAKEETEKTRTRTRELRDEAKAKSVESKRLLREAVEIAKAIREGDKPREAIIAPGVMEKVVEAVFRAVRKTPTADDLPVAPGGARHPGDEKEKVEVPPPAAAMSARKYVPYDRSLDRVERIGETPEARKAYEKARKEYASVIQETTERLRRLRPPVKTRVTLNADNGRLDPRKAYRLGLALKGATVDVNHVWKTTTVRPDPKVAVSLLLDCSGSMAGDQIDLARKAACALSEVMAALHIPHEIVGHTTDSEGGREVLTAARLAGDNADDYSRMLPFRGYVFKEFAESIAPASVFADFSMQENLDGEAVLWALQRLARRRERTKLCIVMCDGLPAAMFSRRDELERHLYTVCRHADARAREGLHLCALGIGEERVREFYQNAEVLKDVAGLPRAVLGIVERILRKAGLG